MPAPEFDLDAYLERIGHAAVARPTADALERLQRAQLSTIPFENFDILLGRGISIEPNAIFEKLVHKPRGGYCFELNGLFLMALAALGYEARALLARVHLTGRATGRTHQLTLVEIQGHHWIADVGFGGATIRAPIPLVPGQLTTHDEQTYRLLDVETWGTMLQVRDQDAWQNMYSFDLENVCHADIALGNHFTSTHPSSFFTFSRVAAMQTGDGRITLLNHTLKQLAGTEERIEKIDDNATYLEALKQNFGIRLDIDYEQLPIASDMSTSSSTPSTS